MKSGWCSRLFVGLTYVPNCYGMLGRKYKRSSRLNITVELLSPSFVLSRNTCTANNQYGMERHSNANLITTSSAACSFISGR